MADLSDSHQIRGVADRLLPPEVSDVDGNTESRRGTVSVFNGPAPVVQICDDEASEATASLMHEHFEWDSSC